MNTRLYAFFCLILLLVWSASGVVSPGYTFERKQPLPISARSVFHPPLSPESESGFCLVKYDNDSVAYYFHLFDAGDGIAVYMDPEFCGFDSTYPFKISNVHFCLNDPPPGFFIWPVEIKVNIREAPEPEDSIQEPGRVLRHKTFSIPEDSAYDPDDHAGPISLYLDTAFCVSAPFFLEIIYTGGTESPYPGLVMSDTTDRPDTNHNWLLWHGDYYEWYDAWAVYAIPGRAVFRVTGYPQAIDCELCWRWMPKMTKAPGGMPDFDQYQFGSDSVALCAPTAVANCLVWLNAIPSISDPDSLIRLLSDYFHTDPWEEGGTLVDSLKAGLDSFFADYGLNLSDTIFHSPTFVEVADSLEKSVSTVLLLGLWQRIDNAWYRIGGHYLSPAGVCESSSWIALGDPAGDNTESGAMGRILPTHDPHPDDHILHNTKGSVSHDAYASDTLSILPDTTSWILRDLEGHSLPWLSQFEGQNFQPEQQQYAHAYDPAESLYAVVEYAIMILEKPTLVEEGQQETPKRFELFDSFPNPFNNQAVIRYRLEKTADVSLAIYNLLGQRVRTLVRGKEQSGSVTVIWDGKDDRGGDLSSGIYFCRLQAGESSQTKKLVLLK